MKRIFLLLICMLFAMMGCAPEGLPSQTPAPAHADTPAPITASTPSLGDLRLTLEEYPVVDGSTATIPLSLALAEKVTGETDMEILSLLVEHSGTSNAYENLLWGDAQLLIVYAPSESMNEMIEMTTETGPKLIMEPIGRDALVFLANEKNPVESLSTEQVKQIYAGSITNWKQVGGGDAPILAFQRNSTSGSQALLQRLVMKDTPMVELPADKLPIGEMNDLVNVIASYENDANALGYSVYYYVKNMYMQPGIKLLSVNGVAPDNDTIRSGEYPLVNDFYAVMMDDAPMDSPERKLFEYITGNPGKALIEKAGYVSK